MDERAGTHERIWLAKARDNGGPEETNLANVNSISCCLVFIFSIAIAIATPLLLELLCLKTMFKFNTFCSRVAAIAIDITVAVAEAEARGSRENVLLRFN